MKVVLDTNVVVSALLHGGPTRRFYDLWRSKRIVPYASQPVLDEYVRVFHYPKFRLKPEQVAGILQGHLLPWIQRVEEHQPRLAHPPRDQHDEAFLRCALSAGARALVSGDPDLTALNGRYVFPILEPSRFLAKYPKL